MPILGQLPDALVSSGNDGAELGHMTAKDDPRAALGRPDGQAALQSLTPLERVLCTGLIARQWARSPRLPRELNRYGVKGTVQLYSATAMRLYLVLLCPPVWVLVILGESAALMAVMVMVVVLALGVYARLATAAHAGKVWRASASEHQPPG
jgi:hypothetical protein